MIDEIAIGIGAVALAVSLLWFFFGKKEAEQASPTGEGVREAVESASGNRATHEESPIEGGPGERLASSTLSIQGMTCAACVMAIEKALMRTQGVQSAAVNLASERATIAYDPRLAAEDEMIEAVQAVGYGAKAASSIEEANAEQERERARHLRLLTLKVALGAR